MSAQEYTEAWLTGPQSTAFYTRTYQPASPKAVVVAVHGFAEHVGRYSHYHPLLSKKGIAVFAYDQRGFGRTALDTEGKKSKHSAWGKTCWADQMEDVNWAINHVKKEFEGTPIFLLGHSMGGAEVLGFTCQEDKSPHKDTVAHLTGVIATSPLITQTHPASKLLKWIGGKLSVLSPNTLVPAEVKAEELSHDEERNAAYMKDPLIKMSGSLRGINDMLTKASEGEELLRSAHKCWPKKLPLLLVHGTEDKVTSAKSSEAFHQALDAVNKKLVLIEGGFHELQNESSDIQDRLTSEIIQFIEAHVPASAVPQAQPSSDPPSAAAPSEAKGVPDTAEAPMKSNL